MAAEHDQDTQTNEHINAYRWHDCKVIYRSISCAFCWSVLFIYSHWTVLRQIQYHRDSQMVISPVSVSKALKQKMHKSLHSLNDRKPVLIMLRLKKCFKPSKTHTYADYYLKVIKERQSKLQFLLLLTLEILISI